MDSGGAPTIGSSLTRSGGGMSRPPGKGSTAGSSVTTERGEEELDPEELDLGVLGASVSKVVRGPARGE